MDSIRPRNTVSKPLMQGNSGLDAILAKTYKSRLGTCFAISAQSTNLMSSGSDQRIRHVAIVLQSLDAVTSRGLLGQLPPAQSKLVRQAMVHLGTVTPQERAAAFQSMQGLLSAVNVRTERATTKESLSPAAALLASQQSVMNDQIELSIEARHQDRHEQDWQQGGPNAPHDAKSGSWQLMPAEALADILQGERPIVIATVINQVSVERATAIAQALPMQVAAATLAALPHLHLTDAAILRDIQLELERKIGQYQAPQKATAEGLSKLKAIVASMPESQQDSWTKAIAQSNPVLAAKLGWRPDTQLESSPSSTHSLGSKWSTATTTATTTAAVTAAVTKEISNPPTMPSSVVAVLEGVQPPETTHRVDRSRHASNKDIFDDSIILPFHPPAIATTEDSATELNPTVATKHPEAEFGKTAMDDLLQFSDKDFVAVLHASQPQTVLMALSGATKAFVARVERLMHPKDVKRLRKRLTSLGPLQLRDVDAAQTLIAQTAAKMLASGLVEATASVSFLAAA